VEPFGEAVCEGERMFGTVGYRPQVPGRTSTMEPQTMGRNAAIKKYRMHTRGQAIDLFSTGVDSPVVAELLSGPWIRRASELVTAEDGSRATRSGSGKLAEESIEVEWDGERACPTSFRRPGKRRRYQVETLVGYWVEERFWWDAAAYVSRRCFRVVVHTGAIYDLAFDRLTGRWLLVGIGD
jgi:hypothetical protein